MWSLGNDSTAEEPNASQMGLAWLVPLWVDRDQEVWLSHSSHFQQTTFEAFYENMEAARVFSIQLVRHPSQLFFINCHKVIICRLLAFGDKLKPQKSITRS